MEAKKKKKIIERIVILTIAVAVLAILVIFLKDIVFPFLKMEANNQQKEAAELLRSKGFLGYVTVSLVEALQMVVIFIPAEFIQLSSGMAYPWWLAFILCDIGVVLGSSIIYFLVNIFKFDGDILNRQSKIEKYEKRTKSRSTIVFMLLLFIMPIIPFGAICYYGSSKKVPYWKYVLTCMFGVVPSIITSMLMGRAIKEFVANSIPIWLLVLIIIGLAAILFVLLAFVLYFFFFRQSRGTPDSWFYDFMFSRSNSILKHKFKVTVKNNEEVRKIEGPCLILANHHCFYDFNFVYKIDPDRHSAFVVNRYYFQVPVLGKLLKTSGFIPKKIFSADLDAVKKIIETKDKGYSITIFPEARLSTDGVYSYLDEKISSLCKALKIPVVLVRITGGYFCKPKWRKKSFKGNVEVDVKQIIHLDELESMSKEEIYSAITSALQFNEFDYVNQTYKQKNKAVGLENILYRCPHCGELYTNTAKGNKLVCSHCHHEYEIDESYKFKSGDIKDIHEYYEAIKELERKEIDNINMDIKVDTKIFFDVGKKHYTKKEKGTVHLDSNKFSYIDERGVTIFEKDLKLLEGIAYSVNEEFELYHEDKLYYFYPEGDRKICTRVALLFELIQERNMKNGTNSN